MRKSSLMLLIISTSIAFGSIGSIQDFRDTVSRIAVISAFDAELAKLRDAAQITDRKVLNGRTVYLGTLQGQKVVLLLSGYSMVNAAMTTQALFDHFNVKSILFSGIAGGVNPGLQVGDVTVPAQWGSYQEQQFARKTESGWDTGRSAAEFANFGMIFPHASSVPVPGGAPDSLERRFWFPADSFSLTVARSIIDSVKLKKCATDTDCLDSTPQIVVGGNGVSGPTFVDNAEYRKWAWETFKADALDMETSAVAHVAYINRTPYIAFRSLSDLAGGGEGKNESRTFGKLAAENSATVVLAYLKKLTALEATKGAKSK